MNTAPQKALNGFLENPADLDHLTWVSPEAVRFFVEELNALTPDKLSGKKLVAAIGTGGTISMKVKDPEW